MKIPHYMMLGIIMVELFLLTTAGFADVLRPLAAAEKTHNGERPSKMQTLPKRLKRVDPYLLGLVGPATSLIVDVGIGNPPYTTVELADQIAVQSPKTRLIGVDYNMPAFVITPSFLPQGFNSYPQLIFNDGGELVAVNGIPISYSGEHIRNARPELYTQFMELKERLLRDGKNDSYKDSAGNQVEVNPLSNSKYNRPNLSYLAADIRQSSIPAGSADIIRDFNMTCLYYKDDASKAIFDAYGRILKEGGYALVGLNSVFNDSEEYTVYRKQQGKLMPYAFVFSVDTPGVDNPGAKSGVTPSFFMENQRLKLDYDKVLLEVIWPRLSEIPIDNRMDYLSRLNRSELMDKIITKLNDIGYNTFQVKDKEGRTIGIGIYYQHGSWTKEAAVTGSLGELEKSGKLAASQV